MSEHNASLFSDELDGGYDVVVVGGGGSGLSAAVQSARNGLHVALLEKMPVLGGCSAFAEGHAAFGSDEQAKRGINVTKQDGFNALLNYSHWRADPAIVSRFVDNADKTVEILRDMGIEYEAVKVLAVDAPDEIYTWHIPKGQIARVIEVLAAKATQLGVDIFLQTAVERIVMADDRVAGVIATDADGQPVRLGARAVVVGTGGFAGNPEMLAKYTGYPTARTMVCIGSPGNTGDGLSMMFGVGAKAFHSIGTSLIIPLMHGKTVMSHTTCAGVQPYLWLDPTGRRFTNEIVGLNSGEAGDMLAGLQDGYAWTILDSAQIDHLVADGCEVGLGEFIITGTPLINLPNELASDVEAGEHAFRGDTLDELARAMGVPPDVLAVEVAEYNTFCHAGSDSRFYKPKYLFPVEKAPFYAIRMEPAALITMGGIKINDDMQVVGEDEQPIPGLYSVGCDAGGLFGESYALTVPGAGCGFALTSGWLAADHVAETLKAAALL